MSIRKEGHHGLFDKKKEAVAEGKAEAHDKVVAHFANIVVDMMDEGFSKAMAMEDAYVPIDLRSAVSATVDAILAERDADRYP
jgi:hypothetical protein